MGRDSNQSEFFNFPGMFNPLVNSSNFNSGSFQTSSNSQELMSNYEDKYSVQLTTLDGMGFTVILPINF